jgi:ATP-dependent RNA helicase DDX52/ROK1
LKRDAPSTHKAGSEHLPTELDFFKYAQDAGQKRKLQSDDINVWKKRRKEDCDPEVEDEDHSDAGHTLETEEQPIRRRHQVKAKGSNVPSHFETFEELRTRFSLPSLIASNLEKYGYSKPTSIQSYAISILLEVRWGNAACTPDFLSKQGRDLAAISPTGTGKTLSYVLPTMIALGSPNSKGKKEFGSGARAVILAPTRELAHQIHNECLKLAEGRKWKIILFSKATSSTLADKNVRDKVGEFNTTSFSYLLFLLIPLVQMSLSVLRYGSLPHFSRVTWT